MADRVQIVLVPPDSVLSRLPLDVSTVYVWAAALFTPVLGGCTLMAKRCAHRWFRYDFVMCNPPFYASEDDIDARGQQKGAPPTSVRGCRRSIINTGAWH